MNLLKKIHKGIIILLCLIGVSSKSYSIQPYNAQQQKIFNLTLKSPQEGRNAIKEYLLENPNDPDSLVAASLNILGLSYGIEGKIDSCTSYFDQAMELLSEDHPMLPRVLKNKAIAFRTHNRINEALQCLFEAKVLAQEQNNKSTLALIYGEMASVYALLSLNVLASEYYLQSVKILEELGAEEITIAIEKQKLANQYIASKDYAFSKKLYDEILPVLNKAEHTHSFLISQINYLEIIHEFEGVKRAIEMAFFLLPAVEASDNGMVKALLYQKLGNFLYEHNQADQANKFYHLAFKAALNPVTTYSLSIINYVLSYYLNTNNKNQFETAHQQIDEQVDKNKFPLVDISKYYNILVQYAENAEDFKTAYDWVKKKNLIDKTLSEQEEMAITRDLKEKYKNERLLNENKLLLSTNQLKSRINILVFVVALALILTLVLIVFIQRQKKRLVEAEKQIIAEKLMFDEKLLSIQAQTIKNLREEVLSQADSNNQLNQKIIKVKYKLENKATSADLIAELNALNVADDEFAIIISKFRILEKDFFDRLVMTYPKLTNKDIEFCALVKMGIDYKKIGEMLNISHTSVFTKKYRIVKKMELPSQVDFISFLNNF
jgi:DNA-binding CsgD family transcriptional regulator